MENKEQELIQQIRKYNLTYVKIESPDGLVKIHKLFSNSDQDVVDQPQNAEEFLYFGVYYEKVKQDYAKMKSCYLAAIKLNNVYAMKNLACYYRNKHKYKLAKQYFQMAANQNDSAAHCELGFHYEYHEKNSFLMKAHYEKAIEYGKSTLAMYSLGNIYYTEKNYDLAEKYFLMIVESYTGDASKKDPPSEYLKSLISLGNLYMIINKNADLAKKYLNMAMNHDNTCSTVVCSLGYYYHFVEHDEAEAERQYLIAIYKGDVTAMSNIAALYKEQKKYELMKSYCLMAIEHKRSIPMVLLASYYQTIEIDHAKAEQYYLMAIEHGHVTAINNYAVFCTTRNKHETAKTYYLKAIDKGIVMAMFNLGYYYETQEQNTTLAIQYYLESIKSGNTESIPRLAKLYQDAKESYKALKLYMLDLDKFKGEIQTVLRGNDGLLFARKFCEKKAKIRKQKDVIEHLKYKPDGIGYLESKDHFDGMRSAS